MVASCGGTTPSQTQNPTLTFSLSPTSANVDQGASVEVAGTATAGGSFSGAVTITVQGAPTGITGVVGNIQTNGATTTATVTLTVGAAVAAGAYPITLRAAGSGISSEATFTLTVNAPAAYTLAVSPDSITLEQSTSGVRDVTLVRTNFTGAVTLTAEGAPTGLVVSFSPSPVSADASAATVTVGGAVPAGTYPVVIRGTATGLADRTDTLTVTVVVAVGPAYTLALTPDTLIINVGDAGVTTVNITRLNSHTDTVSLDLIPGLDTNTQPLAVVGTFVPDQVTGNTSVLTVAVGLNVPPATYTVTVRGQDNVLGDRTVPLVLVIGVVPAYTLTASVDTLSLDQGANGSLAIALARTNFADNVALTVEGLPTGTTGSFSPASTTGDASALTVTVGSSVTPGDYTLTVRGTSILADVTDTFVLTVTVPVGFSLSSIPDLTIQQGGSGSQQVTITRTGGFTGAVTIVVENLAAGVTATVTPTPTSGDTATIMISATASVPVQTYLPTIRGTASGVPDATTSMDINVTASTGAQVSMDFSSCSAGDRPVWLAYQDGSGPWTQVVGVADVYGFMVASSDAGVAYVSVPSPGEEIISVQYLTQAQWNAGDFLLLCDTAGAKTINVTVANSTVLSRMSLGDVTLQLFTDGPYQFVGVGAGALDLVGFSPDLGLGSARMVIQRDRDIAHLGSLGTVDFAGVDGFDADSATITVAGPNSGGVLLGGMDYATVSQGGSVCSVAELSAGGVTNPYTTFGAPLANQNADDFHVAVVTAVTGTGIQIVRETFHALGDRTLTLGSVLPAITPTDVTAGGNYLRLEADFTLPSEYDGFSSFFYVDEGSKSVAIFVSNGVQSGPVTLQLPDFSGVTGWTDSWAPAANAASVSWGVTGSNRTSLQPSCAEGVRVITAVQTGAHN